MNENQSKIEQLRSKINEFEQNYELAKQARIDLIETIAELDEKLSTLAEELAEANKPRQNSLNVNNKKQIKKSIKRALITFVGAAIICGLINLMLNKPFIAPLSSYVMLFFMNTIYQMAPHIVEFMYKRKNKKHVRTTEEITKEYEETLEQRLAEGQKYGKVRGDEVLAEKIFKGTKQILLEQIESLERNNKTSNTPNEINTNDIYSSIVLSPDFLHQSIETKIRILDEELRKYLSKKVSALYYNSVEPSNFETFSAVELFRMLSNGIKDNDKHEKLSHIIHAVLNFVGNIQGYGIVWYEESDESLINSPEIKFDEEGKWTELKTHNETNYELLFELVYDTFLTQIIKKNKTRKKETQ